MRTLDMTVDNPGNWLIHCHVTGFFLSFLSFLYFSLLEITAVPSPSLDHSSAGMQAYYQVAPISNCTAGFQSWL